MATWKKVIVSGSSISQLDNDANYLASTGGGIVSASDFSSGTRGFLTASINGVEDIVDLGISNIGIVSASTFSSPAQGEFTASINGEEQAIDLGLQTTDDVEFATITGSLKGDVVGNLTGIADSASFADADDVYFVGGNNQTLTNFSSSIITTIAANAADALEMIADDDVLLSIESAETASFLGGEGIDTTGAGNAITIAMADNYSIAGSGSVGDAFEVGANLTVTGDATLSGNATIAGDLTVNGTTTSVNSTNLNIEDKFILLSSGSTSANDAGIVIEGQGASFGWDESENRWAFDFAGATFDQTTIGADAYAAAVVTTDDANYQKNGNIRIESNEIYIYVE